MALPFGTVICICPYSPRPLPDQGFKAYEVLRKTKASTADAVHAIAKLITAGQAVKLHLPASAACSTLTLTVHHFPWSREDDRGITG